MTGKVRRARRERLLREPLARYELNGEDSRTLAAVGAFRVVPERDIEINGDTLDHLRDEGLIRSVALGDSDRAVVLTKEGRDLLDANRRGPEEGDPQTFYAGVGRAREIDHDAAPTPLDARVPASV